MGTTVDKKEKAFIVVTAGTAPVCFGDMRERLFLSGCCSETEVSEQLWYLIF
jgi:hypothetical protein